MQRFPLPQNARRHPSQTPNNWPQYGGHTQWMHQQNYPGGMAQGATGGVYMPQNQGTSAARGRPNWQQTRKLPAPTPAQPPKSRSRTHPQPAQKGKNPSSSAKQAPRISTTQLNSAAPAFVPQSSPPPKAAPKARGGASRSLKWRGTLNSTRRVYNKAVDGAGPEFVTAAAPEPVLDKPPTAAAPERIILAQTPGPAHASAEAPRKPETPKAGKKKPSKVKALGRLWSCHVDHPSRDHVADAPDQRDVSVEVTDGSVVEMASRDTSSTSLGRNSDDSSMMSGSAAQDAASLDISLPSGIHVDELTKAQCDRMIQNYETTLVKLKALRDQDQEQQTTRTVARDESKDNGGYEVDTTPPAAFDGFSRHENVPGVAPKFWRWFEKTSPSHTPMLAKYYLLPMDPRSDAEGPRIGVLRKVLLLEEVFLARARQALGGSRRCVREENSLRVKKKCRQMMWAAYKAEMTAQGLDPKKHDMEWWGQREMLGFQIVSDHEGKHNGLGVFRCPQGKGIFAERKDIVYKIDGSKVSFTCNWLQLQKELSPQFERLCRAGDPDWKNAMKHGKMSGDYRKARRINTRLLNAEKSKASAKAKRTACDQRRS